MFKTPILILVYNRSKNLNKLINLLRKIRAKNIYVSFDGPKKNQTDIDKCNNVKKNIENIDWKCNLYKNFLNTNNGCKLGVSKGLEWFFSKVDRGIIIEDDCKPSQDFFIFSEWALIKYKKKNKIGGITGNNFLKNKINITETFYYSKYAHCWGWATWRRTWEKYDKDIKFWKRYKSSKSWNNYFSHNIEKRYWEKIFNNVYNKMLDSWAYPWMLGIWKNNQLIITPKKNLVLNVGFSRDATHTNSRFHNFQYKTFKIKKPYYAPKKIEVNKIADNYVFKNHYKGINYLWPYRMKYLIKFFFVDPISFLKKTYKLF